MPELPVLDAHAIEEAARRIGDVVARSPLQANQRLSALTGARVLLKREDLQAVRSYKIRGAYNLISQLTPAQRDAGVICASAGNHGQGVAYACARLGISGVIYVPSTTPRQKRRRMVELGEGLVELVVTGDTYDDAAAAAHEAAAATGRVLVPAFDDPRTIAGQGTLALELVNQLGGPPDVLVVPVGGGGMLAGCLTWLGARYPETQVIGVEPAGAPSMAAALNAGRPVELDAIDSFVDGAAVRRVGALTHAIAGRNKPTMVAVPEGKVCSEMLELYQSDGIIAEPAGALTVAALSLLDLPAGATVVAVISGGNNDLTRYSEIQERALVYEGRKHYFLVNFPQEPGALRRFLDEVLGPEDDITLFEYVKRSNRDTGPALVGIELGDPADLPGLLERMSAGSMTAEPVDADSPFYRFLI